MYRLEHKLTFGVPFFSKGCFCFLFLLDTLIGDILLCVGLCFVLVYTSVMSSFCIGLLILLVVHVRFESVSMFSVWVGCLVGDVSCSLYFEL